MDGVNSISHVTSLQNNEEESDVVFVRSPGRCVSYFCLFEDGTGFEGTYMYLMWGSVFG